MELYAVTLVTCIIVTNIAERGRERESRYPITNGFVFQAQHARF
jgi:hypothetical protein